MLIRTTRRHQMIVCNWLKSYCRFPSQWYILVQIHILLFKLVCQILGYISLVGKLARITADAKRISRLTSLTCFAHNLLLALQGAVHKGCPQFFTLFFTLFLKLRKKFTVDFLLNGILLYKSLYILSFILVCWIQVTLPLMKRKDSQSLESLLTFHLLVARRPLTRDGHQREAKRHFQLAICYIIYENVQDTERNLLRNRRQTVKPPGQVTEQLSRAHH